MNTDSSDVQHLTWTNGIILHQMGSLKKQYGV
uniref:Uncharacterized protein n=1 Tax=Arundo donax TaxID=35708 RepID=A0A0A8YB37_ARUDO